MSSQEEDRHVELKGTRWQFSLARMLFVMTLAAVLFAAYGWSGRATSSAVVGLAMIAAVLFLTPRMLMPFFVILLCAYSPYVWLLLIDYPWTEYRWFWICMWPCLPGLASRYWWYQNLSFELGNQLMAVITILLLAPAVYFASLNRWLLVTMALIVLSLSVLNSFLAYGLFRS